MVDGSNNQITLGSSQHGFKKKRSTTSLSLTIQTIISQALEDDCHALMESLDLSAAFDTVNIDLLLRRMELFHFYKLTTVTFDDNIQQFSLPSTFAGRPSYNSFNVHSCTLE